MHSIQKAIIASTLALSACATPTLQPPPDRIDYGTRPTSPESAIRAYMDSVLKEPESAKYRFDTPAYRAYANQAPRDGGTFVWSGYRIDFTINAKNGYGGYTGHIPYVAIFKNDEIVRVYENGTSTWVFTTDRE